MRWRTPLAPSSLRQPATKKPRTIFDKLGTDVAAASATKAGASPGTLTTPNPNDPLAGLGL